MLIIGSHAALQAKAERAAALPNTADRFPAAQAIGLDFGASVRMCTGNDNAWDR